MCPVLNYRLILNVGVIRSPVQCMSYTPMFTDSSVENSSLFCSSRCRSFVSISGRGRFLGGGVCGLPSPSLPPPSFSVSHTTVLTDGSDRLSWPVMSVGGYCCKEKGRWKERGREIGAENTHRSQGISAARDREPLHRPRRGVPLTFPPQAVHC